MPSHVEGGDKIRAYMHRFKTMPETVIDVGFKTGGKTTIPVVLTAFRLEYGQEATNLPERPAFRAAASVIRQMHGVWIADAMKGTQWREPGLSPAGTERVANLLVDAVKDSYLSFHGAPTGERQRERKAGTPGEGRQLVGSSGPKLIDHISAWIDGRKQR